MIPRQTMDVSETIKKRKTPVSLLMRAVLGIKLPSRLKDHTTRVRGVGKTSSEI